MQSFEGGQRLFFACADGEQVVAGDVVERVELQGSVDVIASERVVGEVEVDESAVAVGEGVARADLEVLVDGEQGLLPPALVEEDARVFEVFVSLHIF